MVQVPDTVLPHKGSLSEDVMIITVGFVETCIEPLLLGLFCLHSVALEWVLFCALWSGCWVENPLPLLLSQGSGSVWLSFECPRLFKSHRAMSWDVNCFFMANVTDYGKCLNVVIWTYAKHDLCIWDLCQISRKAFLLPEKKRLLFNLFLFEAALLWAWVQWKDLSLGTMIDIHMRLPVTLLT